MVFHVAISLLIAAQYSGVHAHNYQHPPDSGPSPISEDPMSSRYDPSPDIPGIHDYPNHNDRMFLNSIMQSSVFNNDSLASPLDLHRLFNCPIIRKARAASANSQEFLDHVNIIARIANGISLQSGLMNDKINIEDVVGEILNFGDVPVSTIAKFKPEPIKKFATKLEETPKSLDSSVPNQEKQILEWFELRKSSQTIGNVTHLAGKSEYFSYLESLNSSDFNLLTGPTFHMENAKNVVRQLKDDKTPVDRVVSLFGDFSYHFQSFLNSFELFKTRLEGLRNSEFQKGPAVYVPVEDTVKLILKRDKFSTTLTDSGKTKTVSNLKSIIILSGFSNDSIQDVNTLTSLSRAKSNPGFQERNVTSGFSNGVSDVNQLAKDVRNPWIAKIIGIKGSLDSLNDGLQPLFNMNKRLGELEEKLATVSAPKLVQSLSSIQALQRELSKVHQDGEKMTVSAWDDLKSCLGDYNVVVPQTDLAPIEGVIKAIKALTQFSDFKLKEADFVEYKTKIDQFINSLGFTDLTNRTESAKQATGIMERLKKNKAIEEIEKTVDNLTDMFAHFKDLEAKVKEVVLKKNTVIPKPIIKEQGLYQCLKAVQNTDKVAQAITVAQKLRSQKNDVTAVDSAILAVSSASKVLSNLGRLTTDIKRNPGVTTTDLNELSNSATQSKVIGQSAASLRFAHGLKELDPEISHLKTVDSIVKEEIRKISDKVERDGLASQWGNHTSDMDSLHQTLSGILEFESKLSVSNAKTLEEFSSPLKNLGSIPDAKINALEKSEVLEALIAQPKLDPKIKPELEKAKQTLDKLAPLDLGFASHQSEFQKAPGAFKALQNFLVGFFTVKRKVVPPSPNNGNSSAPFSSNITGEPTEKTDHTTMYIVFGFLGFLLLGASIGGGIGAFCWRRKKNQEEKKRLEEEEKEKKRREKEKEDKEKEEKERAEQDKKEAERLAEVEAEKKKLETLNLEAEVKREKAEKEAKDEKQKVIDLELKLLGHRARDRAEEDEARLRFSKEIKVVLSSVKKWINGHTYESPEELTRILGDQMQIVMNYQKQNGRDLLMASLDYLPRANQRYPDSIPCHLETIVKFKFNGALVRIHANHVITKPTYHTLSRNGKCKMSLEFIATQGPLKNTVDDFWAMVWHFKVEFIIMLCDFKEDGNQKCDFYFKSETDKLFTTDQFLIRTLSKKPIFGNRSEAGWKRTFQVVQRKDPSGEKRTLTHYHYLAWPDKGVPNGHEDVSQLLDFVVDSLTPVVVHCSAGIGRTMCLIGTEYMAAEVKNNPNYTVAQGGIDLRNVRCNGIQTFEQMIWLVASVIYRLSYEFDLGPAGYEIFADDVKKARQLIFKKDLELGLKFLYDFKEGDMDEEEYRKAVEKEKKEKSEERRKKSGKDTRIVMDLEDGEEVAGPGVEVIELEDEEEFSAEERIFS
ncbi:unnamed protein product [Caenorhabditis nigoni]